MIPSSEHETWNHEGSKFSLRILSSGPPCRSLAAAAAGSLALLDMMNAVCCPVYSLRNGSIFWHICCLKKISFLHEDFQTTSNSLLFDCKTSFQVKIDHEITKITHFPKTCIKIADFTKPLRSPYPIYVGIFTHDLKSTVRPSLSFQINLIAMTQRPWRCCSSSG